MKSQIKDRFRISRLGLRLREEVKGEETWTIKCLFFPK